MLSVDKSVSAPRSISMSGSGPVALKHVNSRAVAVSVDEEVTPKPLIGWSEDALTDSKAVCAKVRASASTASKPA